MPALAVAPAWKLARGAARSAPLLGVAMVFSHLARGGFSLGQLSWWEGIAIALLLVAIGSSAVRAAKREAIGAPRLLRDDLELGGSLIAAAYAVVAIAGPQLFPIVYLLMAFLVSFLPRPSGLALLGVALVFDAVVAIGGSVFSASTFAIHCAFLVLFAAMYHLVLSARLAAARKAEREAVKKRIQEAEERARTFRLVSSGTQGSQGIDDQEKWLLASVKEVEGAVAAALQIAETALETHTCAAFLLSADDRFLKLYDCRSKSDRVQRERFPAGEGVLGGVLKRGVPVRLSSPDGLRGITFYESAARSIGSVLAAPIVEAGGLVRGVVVADRLNPQPFSDREETLLVSIAGEVLRAIEIERVMGYIRKARDEKDRFFRAIEELNRAGSPEQVFPAVLESARMLAELDFCAVTLVCEDGGKRTHRIVGVTGQGKALEGRTFADNNGLVANVVRYGAPLPGRDIASMDKQVIFEGEIQVRGLAALKIFPLIAGDRIVGTLVAGSRKKTHLDRDVLRMIEVMAIQAAHAVLRAQLYEQMERMATTDGLTGLLNRRAFQARADEAMAQARRYKQRCSLILADIDHFKAVNDAYGHPIGDAVLKGVARILSEKGRDTDWVGRYGGEEFAIMMPQTDVRGAEVIAERIREAVGEEVFQTELGPLRVTISLGIASYPEHGEDRQAVIDMADQCLYHCKKNGRNQVTTVAKMRAARRGAVVEAGTS